MIPERAVLADSASELQKGVEEGKWVFIRTIEGGAALGGDLEKIVHFAKKKIKMMTLTWNGENELGSGCAGTGGLTGFGKEAVKLMEENGIIVDCAHLNDAGFEDLLNITKRPFVASHSNLRSCCEVPRNLREDQFVELVRRGGLCGINLYSVSFLFRIRRERGSANCCFAIYTGCWSWEERTVSPGEQIWTDRSPATLPLARRLERLPLEHILRSGNSRRGCEKILL